MTLKLTETGGQTDGQDHVLSQADALTKKGLDIDKNDEETIIS